MSRKIVPTFRMTASSLPGLRKDTIQNISSSVSVASGSGMSGKDSTCTQLSKRKDMSKGKDKTKGKERMGISKGQDNATSDIGKSNPSKHRPKDSSTLLENILRELRSLKSDVAYIKLQLDNMDSSIVDIGSSHYKGSLETNLANAFVKSLTREVTSETIQIILRETLSLAHFNNATVYQRAKRWCIEKLTTFRTAERRKVIGINPYELYPQKSTSELANNILTNMKAPRDSETTTTYQVHLTLLRHYVQNFPEEAKQKGNLYSNFTSWVIEEFGAIPNIRQISSYLHDTSNSGTDSTLDSQRSMGFEL